MRKPKGRYAIWDGDFWRNPKIETLSLEACGLLAKAVSYSADQMTDGVVPERVLRSWAGKRANRIIKEIMTAHENRPGGHSSPILIKIPAGFLLNTFLKRNISRTDYEQILNRDRERKQTLTPIFRPETVRNSVRNPGQIPGGTLDPRPKTLLRESEGDSPIIPDSEEKEENGGLLPPPPHLQVTRLWIEIGREVTNDPRVHADPGIERQNATKLWAMGRELRPDDPLAALAGPFRSYWTAKRKAGQWPKMRFMVSDFNEHLEAAEKKEAAAGDDREYELRQNIQTLHGRYMLMKTPETEEQYKKAREEYRQFVAERKGKVATG